MTKPKSPWVPPQLSALLCALLWLRPSSSLDMQAICGTFSILLSFHLHTCIMPKCCHLYFSKNHEMFSCLKAKTYHKKPIPSACFLCQMSLKSSFSSTHEVWMVSDLPSWNLLCSTSFIQLTSRKPSWHHFLIHPAYLFLQHPSFFQLITIFQIHLFCGATLPTDCCLYGLCASLLCTHVL